MRRLFVIDFLEWSCFCISEWILRHLGIVIIDEWFGIRLPMLLICVLVDIKMHIICFKVIYLDAVEVIDVDVIIILINQVFGAFLMRNSISLTIRSTLKIRFAALWSLSLWNFILLISLTITKSELILLTLLRMFRWWTLRSCSCWLDYWSNFSLFISLWIKLQIAIKVLFGLGSIRMDFILILILINFMTFLDITFIAFLLWIHSHHW